MRPGDTVHIGRGVYPEAAHIAFPCCDRCEATAPWTRVKGEGLATILAPPAGLPALRGVGLARLRLAGLTFRLEAGQSPWRFPGARGITFTRCHRAPPD